MATASPKSKVRKRKPKLRPMSNARLLRLAKKSKPPQSWYEEDGNPFEPAR